MLGKLPVPGCPTILITVGQGPTALAVGRCGWGLFGHFYSHLSFLFSFSSSLGDGPIKTEILSQRAVKPKTTNQPLPYFELREKSKCVSREHLKFGVRYD